MHTIDAYLQTHDSLMLTLKRKNGIWEARAGTSVGLGSTPSAAMKELERKLRLFAH